ncbi:MAG TPA: TolC family protein [Vicinamibacterales bacterium]|nr:TolC family protein [Vicinamibacterales bacterium]
MRRTAVTTIMLAAGAVVTLRGQAARPTVTFTIYLAEVLRANLDLAAQQAQVDVARAQQTGARARPDWNVLVGLPSKDLSDVGWPSVSSATISVPIELGGKRDRRITAAGADVNVALADHDDAIRLLRGAAAHAFVDALTARNVLQAKNRSLEQLSRIVTVNQDRLRAGDVGEIELVQSRVERDQFQTEVIAAESDVYAMDVSLGQLMGSAVALTTALPQPSGSLEIATRTFDVETLLAEAMTRRSDAISKTRAVQSAEAKIRLAKSSLVPDVGVAATYQHSAVGVGAFDQPADNSIAASIAVNLPIFRRQNPGDVLAAQAAHTQADLQLQAVKLKIEAELRQAYSRYQSAVRRLNLYRGTLIQDSDRVLEARLYAYQRGSATLLEVIDAQRKSAEVSLAYYQALADHAHALVALEQAAGLWDVTF